MSFFTSGRAAVCLVAALAIPALGQPAELKWKWEKGAISTYKMSMKQDMHIGGGPQDMDISTLQDSVYKQKVTEVSADGTATIEQTFESIKMHVKNPMQEMSYDTSKKEDPANSKELAMLGTMVGKTIIIKIDSEGKVSKVEGMDKLMSDAMDAADPAARMGMMQMKQMFSDDSMKRVVEQSFRVVPAKKVSPGDTWTVSPSIPMAGIGTMEMKNVYTLNSMDKSAAKIGVKSTLSMKQDPKGDNPAAKMFNITMEDGAAASGDITFDPAKGQLVKSSVEMKMRMKFAPKEEGGPVGVMNQDLSQKMTVELVGK